MDVEIEEVKAFIRVQKGVRVAYLFGSYAKGKSGPLSDFDIAVLLDECLDRERVSIYD